MTGDGDAGSRWSLVAAKIVHDLPLDRRSGPSAPCWPFVGRNSGTVRPYSQAWRRSDTPSSLQSALGLNDGEFEEWSRLPPSARPSLIRAVVARYRTREAVELTAEELRRLNERIIEAALKAGGTYPDVYEQSLRNIADLSERAGQSQVEWITAVVDAHAHLMREMAKYLEKKFVDQDGTERLTPGH